MEFSNFTNSLLTNLIPPKIQSWSKFLVRNLCSNSLISINTWWIPIDEGSKFELACLESKNSHILWIDFISLKFRLINFVYFFLRHPLYVSLAVFPVLMVNHFLSKSPKKMSIFKRSVTCRFFRELYSPIDNSSGAKVWGCVSCKIANMWPALKVCVNWNSARSP